MELIMVWTILAVVAAMLVVAYAAYNNEPPE